MKKGKMIAKLTVTALVVCLLVGSLIATPVAADTWAEWPWSHWPSIEVQPGDTLWGMARRWGTSVEILVAENDLQSTTIHPGQRLVVPGAELLFRVHLVGDNWDYPLRVMSVVYHPYRCMGGSVGLETQAHILWEPREWVTFHFWLSRLPEGCHYELRAFAGPESVELYPSERWWPGEETEVIYTCVTAVAGAGQVPRDVTLTLIDP